MTQNQIDGGRWEDRSRGLVPGKKKCGDQKISGGRKECEADGNQRMRDTQTLCIPHVLLRSTVESPTVWAKRPQLLLRSTVETKTFGLHALKQPCGFVMASFAHCLKT